MKHLGVTVLDDSAADEIVDVLCESFHAYPVMRFVLGEDNADYDAQLRTLISFFVTARSLRGEPLVGVRNGSALVATTIMSWPGVGESPPALAAIREATWSKLGDEARLRYEAFGEACAPFVPPELHLHVNMIGVRNAARGSGLGRLMLDYAHEMSRLESGSSGVSLTTEVESNISFYQHFGYEIVGHAVVAPGLQSWSFFRQDLA